MSKIIGIDLGTTYSAIAQLDDLGNPEVLASTDTNKKITASIVYLKDKNVIVGDKAIDALAATPKNVVTETKRQMENDVVFSPQKGDWIEKEEAKEGTYSPAQISSFILSKLKGYASDVKKAVITVPALFAEKARVATLDAAKMAGIEVIELINEPTAAACYYASLPAVKKITGKEVKNFFVNHTRKRSSSRPIYNEKYREDFKLDKVVYNEFIEWLKK